MRCVLNHGSDINRTLSLSSAYGIQNVKIAILSNIIDIDGDN